MTDDPKNINDDTIIETVRRLDPSKIVTPSEKVRSFPPDQAPLIEMYWSEETRKRLGLDTPLEPGYCRVQPNEPYDRIALLGVEMTFPELRGVLQRIVDEFRKTK